MWLDWKLPDKYKQYLDTFITPKLDCIYDNDNDLLQINKYFQTEYDVNEEYHWTNNLWIIGNGGCGDYYYIIHEMGDLIFYFDPDRIGEWGIQCNPTYKDIFTMDHYVRKINTLLKAGHAVDMQNSEYMTLINEIENHKKTIISNNSQ